MSDGMPIINWIKRTKRHQWHEDGSVYLVAVNVKNMAQPWRGEHWDIDKVQVCCDSEDFYLKHYQSDEIFDAWTWDDVEWFAVVEGEVPTDGPEEDDHEVD